MNARRLGIAAALAFFATAAQAESLSQALANAPAGSWIEYRVPLIDAERSPCCWGSYRGEEMKRGCSLTGSNYTLDDDDGKAGYLRSGELRVFLRRDGDGLDRIQAYGADCPVDTATETVRLVEGIAPAESLKLLGDAIVDDSNKVRQGALVALSNHDGAVPVLRAVVESDRPKSIRRDALFWLAQVGDDAAFAVFDELLADPATRHR